MREPCQLDGFHALLSFLWGWLRFLEEYHRKDSYRRQKDIRYELLMVERRRSDAHNGGIINREQRPARHRNEFARLHSELPYGPHI